MSSYKNERMLSAVQQAAAEFINQESNGTSLITVTDVKYHYSEKKINVFVSVLPQKDAHAAIDFLTRQRGHFAEFLKKKIKTRAIPSIVFLLDPNMGVDGNTVA